MKNIYDSCKVIFNFNNKLIECNRILEMDIDEDLDIGTVLYISSAADSSELYKHFKANDNCVVFVEFNTIDLTNNPSKTWLTTRKFPNMKIREYRYGYNHDTYFEVRLRLEKVA